MPYAGSSAPSGWLLCDGSAISRTTYVDLFAVISTAFGSGDGSTTFNIPDLRGRTVAGKDNMGGTAANRITAAGSGITGTTLGAAGGAETHTLTTAQIPSHTHNVTGNTTASGTSKVSFASTNASLSTQATSSTGGDGAHNNTQPTMILNYIIKT
jgi:microcystin-dependent protein